MPRFGEMISPLLGEIARKITWCDLLGQDFFYCKFLDYLILFLTILNLTCGRYNLGSQDKERNGKVAIFDINSSNKSDEADLSFPGGVVTLLCPKYLI